MRENEIEMIAAVDEAFGIGLNGGIPWKCAEDMSLFKSRTMGHPLIMGKRTFESMGSRSLPGRPSGVWTHHPEEIEPREDVFASSDIERLLSWANGYRSPTMIIGGRSLYGALMGRANRIILSRIAGNFGCDVYFPKIEGYELIMREAHEGFEVEHWERIK